ncbi:MAG: YihY family inner membrane protein [Myxococcota bacterium]|nr:YihY family inner membrane protein [Myxococcota bacterium]
MALDLGAMRQRVHDYFERDLWRRRGHEGEAPPLRLGRAALQVAVLVAQGVQRDLLFLRASALTYFSMLSLIPILAVAIALVGAFGVSDDIARAVIDRVAAGSPNAGEYILDLVRRVNFGSFGAVGGASLFLTTVLGISSVERAFNAIWGIERERSPVRRFADYLAVIVVAPLLFTVALSLATSLRSEAVVARLLEHPALAHAFELGLGQLPAVLLLLGFAFLYWFLPNTSVRIGPALLGGIIAALLFGVAQTVYIGFNVGVARANALFGSFAALPLLLVWVYVSWTIVLLGCEVAFATQNLSTFRLARAGEEPRPAAREAIGIAVATRIARAFRDGEGVTPEQVAADLDVPVRSVRAIVDDLEAAGLVSPRGGADRDCYQLGRAAEAVAVADVLEALRGAGGLPGPARQGDGAVHRVVAEIEGGVREALRARTLADLLEPTARS